MALQLQRIALTRGSGTLTQLTQSATHVFRVDRSGPSLLVDLSGKKPVVHELPPTVLPGKGSEPDTALVIEAADFTPDGSKLVVLRSGAERSGRKPAIEVIDCGTRAVVSSFALSLAKPSGVRVHADGSRLFVSGAPVTLLTSLGGKVLDRIGTEHRFAPSPSVAKYLFEFPRSEWRVRPVDKAKFVSFEAGSAWWRDDETLISTTWKSTEEDVIGLVDAKTGKTKKLATLPRIDSLEAFGDQVLASSCKGKKAEAFVIALPSGKVQRFELPGSPSGTRVSFGPKGAFIAVNWQKSLHVLASKVSPRAKSTAAR